MMASVSAPARSAEQPLGFQILLLTTIQTEHFQCETGSGLIPSAPLLLLLHPHTHS